MKLPISNDIKIVVLDRGFVFIGYVTEHNDKTYIDEALCIRKWGTDKGLGQLRNGPLKETILDPSGTITAPNRAVIFTIDCEPAKWTPHLK